MIRFHPKCGMVLICNYETGFVPPEMVKVRRVVVVSSDEHNKHGVCTVVPISTTPPVPESNIHVKIEAGIYDFFGRPCWVKCNMVNTVAYHRLDRLKVQGKYLSPSLSTEDCNRIRLACLQVYGKV